MKITEKQLYENVASLWEKIAIYEETAAASYAPGDTASADLLRKAEADKAARAQAAEKSGIKGWWNNLTSTMGTTPTQTTAAPDKSKTEKGGTAYVPYSATTQPQVAGFKQDTAKQFNWNDKNAIMAFQKANVGLDGKPLKVDGLIGAQTMQLLAKQGIQPPAGFKMAGTKAPTVAKTNTPAKPKSSTPSVSATDYASIEADYQKNKAQADATYDAATKQAAQTRRDASNATVAANAPGGINPALARAYDAQMTKPTAPQSLWDKAGEKPTTNEHVSFDNIPELTRIISLARY